MSKFFAVLFCVLLVLALLFFTHTPTGRSVWNKYEYTMQKIDDATKYETRKQVEDSCRAMISSYTADKLTYEQYKDIFGAEQRIWAEQAKMRANKTAATYNEYVLKNSYVWEGNVPADIRQSLAYLE